MPRWSGDLLDFVVDYATYVFVPAYAIATGGVLPQPLGPALGILIAVTGALYFADRQMKTTDGYFRGFPVLWNLWRFTVPFASAPLALRHGRHRVRGSAFAPLYFVHPVRASRWRAVNLAMLVCWAVLALWALTQDLAPWLGRRRAIGHCGLFRRGRPFPPAD